MSTPRRAIVERQMERNKGGRIHIEGVTDALVLTNRELRNFIYLSKTKQRNAPWVYHVDPYDLMICLDYRSYRVSI